MAIKQRPEDFQVEEILTPDYTERLSRYNGPFALYRVTKTSLTTPEVISQMSQDLSLPAKSFRAAGLKDKHGITSQHISVHAEFESRQLPARHEGNNYTARKVAYSQEVISAQAIDHNRFRITLRTLTRRDLDTLNTQIESCRDTTDPQNPRATLWFTNYFGNQRFGGARGGSGFPGSPLSRGDIEKTLKVILATPHRKDSRPLKNLRRACKENWGNWSMLASSLPRHPFRAPIEHLAANPKDFTGAFGRLPYFEQQMAVEAWQSWIWNRVVTRLLDSHFNTDQCYKRQDTYHDINFIKHNALEPRWKALSIPLPGPDMTLQAPWQEAMQQILSEEKTQPQNLQINGLNKPQFTAVPRKVITCAKHFLAEQPEQDELQPKAIRFKQTLCFALPRGCYATTLLRALGQ